MDAQGAEKARPYIELAQATYTNLVDQDNLLSQMFGFRAVPNGLLLDEQGSLQYRKFGGFDIRKQEYAELVEEWARDPSAATLARQETEDSMGGSDHQEASAHFQRGVALYRQGDVKEALGEWKRSRDLEPDNWVVRKQIWAVEHPEKFYQGEIDSPWQREQVAQGT